ncbi:MAG TPA: DNA polymerase III subunit gamma/tau, partial [Rhodospirillaceae bacterium]|nr:DNA polymerase III subunit gamma/tau [Rhodospirillaceae bacterium]
FATTEIRKIPVTVLSRCQRFDLRRVEQDLLAKHFSAIAEKEAAEVEPAAMALICRAADGSVRDGLSLLDQAIAHGAGKVDEAQMRDMLGLADRARVFDLLDSVMKGDIGTALGQMAEQYAVGADPVVVLQDLLELVHWLTRLKLAPNDALALNVPETERVRGAEMARLLSMATLTRGWQILLKGLGETRSAPSPLQAAEMVLIRLAYAADLPSPADALEALRRQTPAAGGPAGSPAPSGGGSPVLASVGGSGQAMAVLRAEPQLPVTALANQPESFAQLVTLVAEKCEPLLAACLDSAVHLVHFEPGRIEFRATAAAPGDLATRLSSLLRDWTGRRWLVSLSRETGAPTLREQRLEQDLRRKEDAANHPLVQAVLAAFPGAAIEVVRDLTVDAGPATDAVDQDPANGEEE